MADQFFYRNFQYLNDVDWVEQARRMNLDPVRVLRWADENRHLWQWIPDRNVGINVSAQRRLLAQGFRRMMMQVAKGLGGSAAVGALDYLSMVTRPRLDARLRRLRDEELINRASDQDLGIVPRSGEYADVPAELYPLWHSSYYPRPEPLPTPVAGGHFEDRIVPAHHGEDHPVTYPVWVEDPIPAKPTHGPHSVEQPRRFMRSWPVRYRTTLVTTFSTVTNGTTASSYGGVNYWFDYGRLSASRLYSPFYGYRRAYLLVPVPVTWVHGAAELNTIYRKHHCAGYRLTMEIEHLKNQTNNTTYVVAYPRLLDHAGAYLQIPRNMLELSVWQSQDGAQTFRNDIGTVAVAGSHVAKFVFDFSQPELTYGDSVNDNRFDEMDTSAMVVPADTRTYAVDWCVFSHYADTLVPSITWMLEQDMVFYDPDPNIHA